MKTTITIILLSCSILFPQGITNTLGGDSSSDKFILENSSGNDILTATGDGKVGIGIPAPKSILSIGGEGNSNYIVYLEGSRNDNPVLKAVSNSGLYGIGVSGESSADYGYGIYGKSTGPSGIGVYGSTTSTTGSGVKGFGNGEYSSGIDGQSFGENGMGVKGVASAASGVNYGGYFKSDSPTGYGLFGTSKKYGVYGKADATSGLHYGGFFKTENPSGRGIYATNTTSSGSAYGGVFEAKNSDDGVGAWADGKKYDFYAAGAGENYGAASSIRWKNNIVSIDNPLEKLSQIRGVYFDWDEEHGGGHDVGCIAEEVGKVLPEIVVYEENGLDAEGMDYSMLTPLLIEAIKALEIRVAELEAAL